MIEVLRLDGTKYWLNPHMIESMEKSPDVIITMLSGKKIILKNTPEEIINEIITYRKKIGINSQEA